MILRPPTFNPAIFRHGLRSRIVRPSAAPVISGFAYPANTLTSTSTGQWFVNGVAQVGQTGTSFVVPLTAIGALIQQANSNVLTCWHPNQIAAVARFWLAGQNALNSVSPDVLATDGQTVRRWNGILSGTPADQASAPSQPIYRSAGQSGNPSIEFDGVDDRLSLPSSTNVFQDRTQGYLIVGCRDTNRTGGAINHAIAAYTNGINVSQSRLVILTRLGGNSVFTAGARRLDTDPLNTAQTTSNADYNVLGSHGDWSNGFIRLRVNGSVAVSNPLTSGSGSTSNTASLDARIGDIGDSGFFPGHITAVCAINAAISPTDLSRIERYIGLLGGLNIPLV